MCVLLRLTAVGWRLARICHGVPDHDSAGTEGLASPDSRAWEITFRKTGALTTGDRKFLAEHATRQESAGYECRLVKIGGDTMFVERYAHGNALRFWDQVVRLYQPRG